MSKPHIDLLIVIRVHAYPDFVIDTFQSVEHCTSPECSKVVLAVDGGDPRFSMKMTELFGSDRVYRATQRCGWGPGLYTLLVNSINYFEDLYDFNHVLSIDYDTLFIGKDADRAMLDRITGYDIGLLGVHLTKNMHWKETFRREKPKFEKIFGLVPSTYIQGEGVQGSALLLTRSLLQEMKIRGMFKPPYSDAKNYTTIADDHLLPIFVRMCGLKIKDILDIAACHWNAKEDPRGLENKGIKLFHPTKLRPRNNNKGTEVVIRNYFRKLRGCMDMLK